jgi:hypothetical protein
MITPEHVAKLCSERAERDPMNRGFGITAFWCRGRSLPEIVSGAYSIGYGEARRVVDLAMDRGLIEPVNGGGRSGGYRATHRAQHRAQP